MTIKDQWQSFARAVLPISVNPIQYQEMRRAFYAGAEALMSVLVTGVSNADDMTADDGNLMESVHREIEQFSVDVKEGRA